MVVEGTMTHDPRRIILCVFSLLFICQLPFFSTNARQTLTNEAHPPISNPDLLIILSPQYNHDPEINIAIQAYLSAVNNDLGWNGQIIPIQEYQNEYQIIDTIIESYETDALKACLMIGEDLDTALGGDTDYLEQPSTLPWATLGGNAGYETADEGIVSRPTTIHLCISLLYPPQQLSYEQKKSSLIFVFNKFTTQRHQPFPNSVRVFESSDLNTYSQAVYQNLNELSNLYYTEDATTKQMTHALQTSCAAFFVHGHSTPSGTDIAAKKKVGWFPAENLDSINTPFFGADGCYVAGWWSTQQDNNHLDPCFGTSWYGAKIFTSITIQAMALGLLSQNGFSTPVSFLENAMPELLTGKTLAESMVGDTTIGDVIIIGDPTFHFVL